MTALKNLTFSEVEAPKNIRSGLNTLERAKAKFEIQLKHQVAALNAALDGKPGYSVLKKAYETDEDGNRKRVDKSVPVRPWWFEKDGKFYVTPKYANKPLELQKGKTSIAAGESLHGVSEVYKILKSALENGDLDKALEAQATAIRKRIAKK